MISRKEAIKRVKKIKPEFRIASVVEKKDSYILNAVPISYPGDPDLYTNGLLRVDKRNGKVEVYNPLLEIIGE